MDRLTKLKFVSAADYYARRMKDITERTGISIVQEAPRATLAPTTETREYAQPSTAKPPEVAQAPTDDLPAMAEV
ncbi:MAG: hypothetical protein KVP17_002044 [Porospora cf. gigantea B]|uniref:uncharacterized protein n=1 Tax=Porospora cf. gigantea B TaxID=2853592 RepID=UPI0035719B8D|nr:MAG: hypothetical protein KVP17_002044 [Porospora cf. gigantea B]